MPAPGNGYWVLPLFTHNYAAMTPQPFGDRPRDAARPGGWCRLQELVPLKARATPQARYGPSTQPPKRRDLSLEKARTFWASAGSALQPILIQYRLRTTREPVPLLQIVLSKTDTGRLLLVKFEFAEVLQHDFRRIRGASGAPSPGSLR